MFAPRSTRRAWLTLLLAAVPTLGLGWVQAHTPIDAENQALKAPTGPDADALARRVSTFGGDHALVLGFHVVVPGTAGGSVPNAGVAALARSLRGIHGVAAVDTLPSPSPSVHLLLVSLAHDARSAVFADTVHQVENEARARCPAGLGVEVTGVPAVELAIAQAVAQEQRWMVPAIAVALFLVLLSVYRRLGLALAALVPAAVAISWSGGLYALLGHRLDPVAALLQPVLLTVGVAYSVHLVDGFLRRAHRVGAPLAVERTARDLLLPATLACGTTVAGFLVNAVSPIPAVATFATYAGFGVALTSAAAFWLVPAALVAWTGGRLPAAPRLCCNLGLVGWMSRYAPAVGLLALVAGVWGGRACFGLRVDNDPLRVLPPRHPLRQDTDALAARLGGVELFDVLVPASSRLTDPSELRLLAAAIAGRPGVAGLAGAPRLAATGDLLLSGILPRSGSTERERLFDAMSTELRLRGRDEALVTGSAVQIARDSNRLVRGQLFGFGLTLAVLWLVMAWGLRSWRLGLLGLVPNVLTCLLVYGAMAAADRPVSVATALIGTVMLGLVVDTTIHVLERFRRARRHGARRAPAVASAMHRAGRAVTVTSLVLVVGFAVAACGRLETTIEFGLLAATTIVVAYVVSMTLLPALLLMRREAAQ
ncbi:MAG: MMPL family transporter [Planctomycetota bacterium]